MKKIFDISYSVLLSSMLLTSTAMPKVCAAENIFFDSFEAEEWVEEWSDGAKKSPGFSVEKAYDGKKSVKVDKALNKRFDVGGNVRASVYLYDPCDKDSLSTGVLKAYESADSNNGVILGLYSKANKNYYIYRDGEKGKWQSTGVSRSKGWHKLTIDATDGTIKLFIDGSYIASSEVIDSFEGFEIGDYWGGSDEAVYFDSFCISDEAEEEELSVGDGEELVFEEDEIVIDDAVIEEDVPDEIVYGESRDNTSDDISPMRPAKIGWGSYNEQHQFLDEVKEWDYVKQNLDYHVMHGAFWGRAQIEDKNIPIAHAIGDELSEYENIKRWMGCGLAEIDNLDFVEGEFGKMRAEHYIERFKLLEKEYNIKVERIYIDWIIKGEIIAIVRKYPDITEPQILGMLTGYDYGCGESFVLPDGKVFNLKDGFFRAFGTVLTREFPNMEITFDSTINALIEVEKKDYGAGAAGKELGIGFGMNMNPVLNADGTPVLTSDGKERHVTIDYADVLYAAKAVLGSNFSGYLQDMPYSSIIPQTPPPNGLFRGDGLFENHMKLERILRDEMDTEMNMFINGPAGKIEGNSQFMYIDLGEMKKVSGVTLKWADGKHGVNFTIEVAGPKLTNFKIMERVTGETGGVNRYRFSEPVEARYVMMRGKLRVSEDVGFGLCELEVYDEKNKNIALDGKAKASNSGGDSDVDNINDGNDKTYYESKYTSRADWDKLFYDSCLAYVKKYQAAGGRSDSFLIYSWQPGPYIFFPEDKPYTFTNTAKAIIRLVKGLEDDGSPMPMDMTVQKAGDDEWTGKDLYLDKPSGEQIIAVKNEGGKTVYSIAIQNNGQNITENDAMATPLIRAKVAGDGVIFKDKAGTDITRAMTAKDGYDGYFAGELLAGDRFEFTMEAMTPINDEAKVLLEVYWNPQDPSLKARDSVAFVINGNGELDISELFDKKINVTMTIGKNKVRVGGNEVRTNKYLDVAPVIRDSYTFVPLRGIFEAFGADVVWNGEEAVVSNGKNVIRLRINSDKATVNSNEVEIGAATRIINDRMMIPLRFVSENLGYSVEWIPEEEKIVIETLVINN